MGHTGVLAKRWHFLAFILMNTRNELASLAHSFYTCLKHQLMLPSIIVLLSSTLDYVVCMMLDPQLYNIITFRPNCGARGAAGCICARAHPG